jgi:predicted permease
MSWWNSILRKRPSDPQMNSELRFHLDELIDEYVAAGSSPEEARRKAALEFGGGEQVKEELRDVYRVSVIETAYQNFQSALRFIRKSPTFSFAVILTLALGIGANTAIFTLLDQVILRLLPVKDPRQLVLLSLSGQNYGTTMNDNALSYPMYRDFQDHNDVFSGMFCRFPYVADLTSGGQSERVEIELVSGTYFDVLGVTPALGQLFTPENDRNPNGQPYVVLSYDYWKTRFGGDPAIVGKNLLVRDQKMTVIGVAKQGFDGVELGWSAKLFVPVMMQLELFSLDHDLLPDRRTAWVNVFGRMKPGVSAKQVQAVLQPFTHAMLEEEVKEAEFSHATPAARAEYLKTTLNVLPGSQGRSSVRDELSTPLWVLMATTGFVLLIACANVANLLLARATGRQKEIALRLALGAGRGRIVSQLLIETLVLSTIGAALGLLLAFWADRALLTAYMPVDAQALRISTAPDLRILLFTIGVTLLTGMAFGLVPALQSSKPDVGLTLKDQAGSVIGGGGQGRLKKALVVAQVALSLLLLIGAGLFVRTLNNLTTLGPGFPISHLVAFSVDPLLAGYKTDRIKIFYRQLTDSLGDIPSVRSVGLGQVRLLDQSGWAANMAVEGYSPSTEADHAQPAMNRISPGYFATLGVPFVAGRDFALNDNQTKLIGRNWVANDYTPTVAIINETFARKYFRGRDPIGMHIGYGREPGAPTDMEIIGVVKDMKYQNLRDDVPDQVFLPYLGCFYVAGMTVYLRTAMEPEQLAPMVRERVRALDPNLPIYDIRTAEAQVASSLATERMIASLSAAFGLLATLLAVIGLYGVMAFTVAQKTREIGIRMALGAARANLLWLVMRDVLLLITVGVALALPASVALTHIVENQLYGISPHDPSTLAFAAGLLIVVAGAAGYIPALRASRVDPIRALRYE